MVEQREQFCGLDTHQAGAIDFSGAQAAGQKGRRTPSAIRDQIGKALGGGHRHQMAENRMVSDASQPKASVVRIAFTSMQDGVHKICVGITFHGLAEVMGTFPLVVPAQREG